MTCFSRRSFVQLASAMCIANLHRRGFAEAESMSISSSSPIPLGRVVSVRAGQTADEAVKGVADLGLPTCQIRFQKLTADVAGPLKNALAKYGVEATALIELGPGRMVWDFYEGPETIGIIPPDTREARISALKLAADVARDCGIPAVLTHCGFIPENPNDPLYPQAVKAVREVASHCKEQGRLFLCETGQETPITLLRMMQDVGLDNVFVNLDLANLILYGKGNPVDAMDVLGDRVRGIHAKDGLFPTDPKNLGKEVPIGEGKVNFPVVLKRLKQANYKGAMTIEREIQGDRQKKDIAQSKAFLETLIAKTYGEG
jgi:sugar phosphate isomerase/epimerase